MKCLMGCAIGKPEELALIFDVEKPPDLKSRGQENDVNEISLAVSRTRLMSNTSGWSTRYGVPGLTQLVHSRATGFPSLSELVALIFSLSPPPSPTISQCPDPLREDNGVGLPLTLLLFYLFKIFVFLVEPNPISSLLWRKHLPWDLPGAEPQLHLPL